MDELRKFIKSIPTLPRGDGDRCEFKFGNCTYRCDNTDEAVADFVKKSLAKLRDNPVSCATKVKNVAGASKRTVLNEFLTAGETDNAVEYARITGLNIFYFASFPDEKPEPILKAREIEPGFVVGYNGKGWTVTHLDSGQSVSGEQKGSEKKAIEGFKECKTHPEFVSRITDAACNFQEKAREVSFI